MNTSVASRAGLDLDQQVDDRGLHRDVERRDRLVGDDHVGIAGERAGDGDALLLAAGELARLAAGEIRRQLDHLQQTRGLRSRASLPTRPAQPPQRRGRWRSRRVARVERAVGVLEHHLQLAQRRASAVLDAVPADLGAARARRWPPVAVSRPVSTLARVDLPQPDSPTMASVRAFAADKIDVVERPHRRPAPVRSRPRRLAVELLEAVDAQHDRAARSLGRRRRAATAPPALPRRQLARPARTATRCPALARRRGQGGIGSVVQRPGSACAQRGAKTQPIGRARGGATCPGIGASGAQRLSLPSVGQAVEQAARVGMARVREDLRGSGPPPPARPHTSRRCGRRPARPCRDCG